MVEVATAKPFYILRPPSAAARPSAASHACTPDPHRRARARLRDSGRRISWLPQPRRRARSLGRRGPSIWRRSRICATRTSENAVTKLEALEARYPFSEEAKQGQLDLLYA